MKRTILFVIGDPQQTRDLSQLLADCRAPWEMTYVRTSAEALAHLQAHPCDLVVAAMSLPDRGGVELMNEIMERHTGAARMLLGDIEEREWVVQSLGTAHQVLLSPFDAWRLKAALARALESEPWVPGKIARKLIAEMKCLPSPPYIYFRVMREMRLPEPSVENIGTLISRDPVMSAKLLRAANSASMGLGMQVVSPVEAVMYLGLENTQGLVLLAHSCSFFEQIKAPFFSVDQVWNHSIRTGQLAQKIARARHEQTSLVDECFTAGLLHDMGKMILAANHTEKFRESMRLVRNSGLQENDAENQVFGTNHAEVGGCLLAGWGVPWPIVEAVALHHAPRVIGQPGFNALAAVHAANHIARIKEPHPPRVDMEFLKTCGLEGEFETWKALAG